MPYPAGLTPSTGADGDLTVAGVQRITGASKNYRRLVVPNGATAQFDSDAVVAADYFQVDQNGVVEFVPAGGATGTEGGTGGTPGGKNGGGGGGGGGYGASGQSGGNGTGGTGGGGGGVRDPLSVLTISDRPPASARGASGGTGGGGKDNTLDYGNGANGAFNGGGGPYGAGTYSFTTFIVPAGQTATFTNPVWIRAINYIDVVGTLQVTGGDPHAVPYRGGAGGAPAFGSGGGAGGGGHNGNGSGGAGSAEAGGDAGGIAFDNLGGWAQNDYSAAQGGAA